MNEKRSKYRVLGETLDALPVYEKSAGSFGLMTRRTIRDCERAIDKLQQDNDSVEYVILRPPENYEELGFCVAGMTT